MLLDVQGLAVTYGRARVVDGVSFQIAPGEALGIVGESGSGKTTVARAVLRLLPRHARVEGQVYFDGVELLRLPARELRRLRWRRLSVVFQSTMSALTPVYRIDDQIAEAIRTHQPLSRAAARRRAAELLERTGVAGRFARAYPHQLSGGMRQRACIAMALALEPDLVIADEPTTALDVLSQALVLEMLARLRADVGCSSLLISHDLALIMQACDRVLVMYAGRIVEQAPVRRLYAQPVHPYTMGLLHCVSTDDALIAIPGTLPNREPPIVGCAFAPRCPFAQPVCRTTSPPLVEVRPGHLAACHRSDAEAELRRWAADPRTWEGA